jgi:hypothetical protein
MQNADPLEREKQTEDILHLELKAKTDTYSMKTFAYCSSFIMRHISNENKHCFFKVAAGLFHNNLPI